MATPTPHIGANLGDVAKTVLMPGDPLRAKLLADTYLTDVKQFNTVRNMFGYTGYYKGVQVSVMGSGMGMPSIGIYSHELYNFYGVENILRIGSAGAINMNVKVRDIILAIGACTNSAFGEQFSLPGTFAPVASYDILKTADKKAEEMGLGVIVGKVLYSDTFYCDDASRDKDWQKMMQLLQGVATDFVTITPDSPRALTNTALAAYLTEQGCAAQTANSVAEAVTMALEWAKETGGVVVACGSLYMASEVREYFAS